MNPLCGSSPAKLNHNSMYPLMSESVSAILYPTVLLAEDSQDTRSMLKRAFELKGYKVFEAEDGQEALDMARRYRPSLIVIDLNKIGRAHV